jgi:hypothetical protein
MPNRVQELLGLCVLAHVCWLHRLRVLVICSVSKGGEQQHYEDVECSHSEMLTFADRLGTEDFGLCAVTCKCVLSLLTSGSDLMASGISEMQLGTHTLLVDCWLGVYSLLDTWRTSGQTNKV